MKDNINVCFFAHAANLTGASQSLVDLALFKEFSKFCKKNNIKYFALGGTLLGAVRHKGFIPWDDDMDLGVPREDYEKLLLLCSKEKVNFELHTFDNDENHYRYFARLEDSSVKIKRNDKSVSEISSAWIDIFPLDGIILKILKFGGQKIMIQFVDNFMVTI